MGEGVDDGVSEDKWVDEGMDEDEDKVKDGQAGEQVGSTSSQGRKGRKQAVRAATENSDWLDV